VYGSLILGVTVILEEFRILLISEFSLQVTSLTSKFFDIAYFAMIGACFHHEAL